MNQVSIGSNNGLLPGRCQAIIWTNAGILLIGPLGANFTGIFIKIQDFSFTKMQLKISSAKWWPFCPGGDGLTHCGLVTSYGDRSRSTLAQVMACCLTAPCHYLNQCWLMINEVLWHSPDSNLSLKWVWNLLILDCIQTLQGPMS